MRFEQAIKLMGGLYGSGNLKVDADKLDNDIYLREAKVYKITEIGISYYNYLRDEMEKERLGFEKLKIDTKNAKRIFKTYWWTFGFAVAGFLISLVLLILKLKEL
ncbi:MAG TPA: hypothetical protein VEV62_12300 [Parafilimonas sp.]|nr:hypothetical protein [Parafilimonas sp.]